MLTFKEYLEKRGVLTEVGMSQRIASAEKENLPDTTPEEGQIVILMDKDKAVITNNDLYYVMMKNSDEIRLIPKTAIDQRNPSLGSQLHIKRGDWANLTLVNHLLTPKEKARFGYKTIWMTGLNKDKWIKNRTKKPAAQEQEPMEIGAAKLAQLRQQFQQRQEEPDVTAARSWLQGAGT